MATTTDVARAVTIDKTPAVKKGEEKGKLIKLQRWKYLTPKKDGTIIMVALKIQHLLCHLLAKIIYKKGEECAHS